MTSEQGSTVRRLGRGVVEIRGDAVSNRYREEVTDAVTGERTVRARRWTFGTLSELRTLKAANEWLDEHLAMLTARTLKPGRPATFLAYSERFIAVQVAMMRLTSRRTYTRIIRQELQPAFRGRQLAEIDEHAIQRVIASRAQTHARSTCALTRTVALQVLRQARRDGFAAHAVEQRAVRLPKTQRVEVEPRHIDDLELGVILLNAPWPSRALWAALGYAALRIGEGLGLTWEHVDFERKVVRVRQAAVDGRLAPLKTAASRADVPMLPPLAKILLEYREQWRPNDQGLLFATRRGPPLRSDYVRMEWLRPQLRALKLPRAGCHAFRHGAPARLNAMGLTPVAIQHFMRHQDLKLTQRYLHYDHVALIAEVEALFREGRAPPELPP